MRFSLARGRSVRLILAITLLVVLGGAGAAYAAGRSSGTIKVCVAHSSGTLYKHATCKRGDSTLSWNARGPRGPAGAPATSLWALVDGSSSPTIIYDKGVSSVSDFSGTILVTFTQNVSKCAFIATPASTGGGYYSQHPIANISEEFYSGGWGANGKTVGVNILDNTGSAPETGYYFSIAAYC
jgi:hypothetical protein